MSFLQELSANKMFETPSYGSVLFANSVAADINIRHSQARADQKYFRFRATDTEYFEDELIQILESGTFYFPAAKQMNDPFDAYPIFNSQVSFEDFRNVVYPIMWTTVNYNLLKLKEIGRLSSVELMSALGEQNLPTEEDVRQIHETFCKNIEVQIDLFFKQPRLLSLSGTHDNQMLWSMYAKRHTGVCFEISGLNEPQGFDHPDTMGHKMRPVEVLYGDDRPTMNAIGIALCHVVADTKCLQYLPRVAREPVWKNLRQLDYIRTKNSTWSHENEFRLIIHGHEDGNHFKLKGIRVPRIFLGFDIPDQVESEIVKLTQSISPETVISKAEISNSKQGLEFKPM